MVKEGRLVSRRGIVPPVGSKYVVPEATNVPPEVRVFSLMIIPGEGTALIAAGAGLVVAVEIVYVFPEISARGFPDERI
jgi:hypothetical protein